MKILLFIFILIISSVSCAGLEPDYNYTFAPENHLDKTFESVEDLNHFVHGLIKYTRDTEEHWRYPHDTYNLGIGDCEDKALLKMCWFYYSFGLKGQIYTFKLRKGYHAVFFYDGSVYDEKVYTLKRYLEFDEVKKVEKIFSYEEALGKCK